MTWVWVRAYAVPMSTPTRKRTGKGPASPKRTPTGTGRPKPTWSSETYSLRDDVHAHLRLLAQEHGTVSKALVVLFKLD